MIKFTLDKKEYSMPTSWDDLTFRQFEQLSLWSDNRIQLISILTGVPVDTLENTSTLDIDEQLDPFCKWLSEKYDEKKAERLRYINFRGVRYNLPKDLTGKYNFAQKIELKERMVKCINETGNTYDIMPFAVAVFIQPLVAGEKYSTDKADALVEEIKDCNLSEVYSIASFFLKKLIALQNEKQPLLGVNIVGRKRLPGLLRWMGSKNLRPSILFPEVTSRSTSKC